MTTFRRGVPALSDRFLTHAIIWLAAFLALSVAAFGAYYVYDRQSAAVGNPFDQTVKDAEEMVRLNPDHLGARLALAGVYFDRRDYANASAQYRAALTIDESSLIAQAGLGRSLSEQGEYAAAAPSFRAIISATASSDVRGDLLAVAYYFLGKGALATGDYDEAIAQLQLAVETSSADADALLLLGTAFVAQGRFAEAIPPLTRATRFVPDFGEAYQQLALAYDATGATARARYARAMQQFSSGNLKKAESELRAAVQSDPAFADAWVGLGFVLERLARKPDAIAAYREALAIDSGSFNARQGLVRLGALADGTGAGAHGSVAPKGAEATDPAKESKP